MLSSITGAIGFLEMEDRSHEVLEFWNFSQSLDKLHRRNTLDLIPELRLMFDNAENKPMSDLRSTP